MSTSVLSLVVDTRRMLPGLQQVERGLSGVSAQAGKLGVALLGLSIPAGLFAHNAVGGLVEFDSAMTNSLSIMSGVTPQIRKQINSISKQLSTELPISATDAAKSFEYLALAGLDAQQSMAALPVVAKFATAGNFDMAKATDMLTDAQAALGLTSKDAQKNMLNMTLLADTLAKAAVSSNASISQFSEALTNEAATTMRAYNISIEEGVALLGNYADQGIKGDVAGSLFSRGIRLVTKAAKENADEWKRYGIEAYNAQGELRPFSDLARQLEKVMGGMSTEMKVATLDTLGFEARIQQAIFPILGMSNRLDELSGKLRNAGGTMDTIVSRQMKSMSNQIKVMYNTINNFATSIAAQFEPEIRFVTEIVRQFFSALGMLPGGVKKVIGVFIGLAAVVAPAILAIAGVAASISSIAAILAPVGAAILPVAAIMAGFGAVATAVGLMVWNSWDMISNAILSAYNVIVPSTNGMAGSMRDLWDIVSGFGGYVLDTLSPIIGNILVIGIGIVTQQVLGLRVAWNIVSVAIRSAIWVIVEGVRNLVNVWSKALGVIGVQSKTLDDLKITLDSLSEGFGKGISEDVDDLGEAFSGMGKNAKNTVDILSGDFKKAMEDMPKATPEIISPDQLAKAAEMPEPTAISKPQEAKFAGLALQGSVEAYKAEISRVGADDQIASNTAQTAQNTGRIARALERQNAESYALGTV